MLCSFDLNFRHLHAVLAIARLGSISGAAEEIHLSQPALTHAVRKLENQLCHKIFDRRAHGVDTTSEGRLFLTHVQDGLSLLAGATQQLRQGLRSRPVSAPERHITSTQLRAFLAVLRSGSYAMAARSLSFSQPSVYRAVRELQDLLGMRLFTQVGEQMRAPDNVQQFARQLRLALASIESGIEELAALHEPGIGRISVGSLPLARSVLLPGVLARFSGGFPQVSMTVSEGQYWELISALREGSIDMVFGALRPDFASPDLQQHELFLDDLYVVGRAGHPLAGKDVPPAMLTAFPWVIGAENSPMRGIWQRFFIEAEAPLPTQRIACGSILLARELMRQGDWLCLMSPHQFRMEEEHGVLARVGRAVPGSIRPIGMTIRRNWRPTVTQRAFLDLTTAMAATLTVSDVAA